MAKINHSNFLDVVDDIWTSAKEIGIMHLNSKEEEFDGTHFLIKGKELKNFGTCGYLGLEKHPKLIEGAIDLVKKFGTQLSMSRAYVRPTYIQELEETMSQIFDGNKVIVYTATSTAHISVIPSIIKPDDLIILDQQVHYSIQYPSKNMKLQGTEVKMIRHSNYDMLEDMIKEEYNKFRRIWYMADGVYSMHGDIPDTDKLKALMQKYPKLHLYFDDAHGMGWGGKNGAGNIFDRMGVSDRIILISTLAKGFGCVGGTAVFGDPEMYRKIDTYGGALTYTHPLSPANTGAALASARIHLSDEIYRYQAEHKELMDHMNKRLKEYNLTNTSSPEAPIYFIGGGPTKVTHNLVKRVLNEGIYVNTATFPVVPNDKSGLRFTLTRHNTKADIDELAQVLAHHLPKAIEEVGEDIEKVYQTFGMTTTKKPKETESTSKLDVKIYNTIRDIDPAMWNYAHKDSGNITHSGMQTMEQIFSSNSLPEENWSFHYIIIKDSSGTLVLSTFFTGALYKDDMLALEKVSMKIDEIRKNDPYYLCSKTLAMGSLFALGDFLFIDKENPEWKEAFDLMIESVAKVKKEINATVVIFRDLVEGHFANKLLEEEGYTKVRMPNSYNLELPKWNNTEELLNLIDSYNSRKNIRRYVLKYEHEFTINVRQTLTTERAKKYYKLFENIKEANYAFNFFKYPPSITHKLSESKDYEFVEICLKGSEEPVAAVWCFIGDNHYSPLVAGLDYQYAKTHFIYKQLLFQIAKRGNDLGKQTIFLGFSADTEKMKYGPKQIISFAFMKVDDTYNLELIESFSNN